MRRLKLLWMSDSPTLVSGFGTVTRDILDRLPTDRFEIAVVGWAYTGWPYDRTRFPYTIYPSDPRRMGGDSLPSAVAEFKPDIVVGLGDLWMLESLKSIDRENGTRVVAYFPIDGAPFPPSWRGVLDVVDVRLAYSEFGRKVAQEACPDLPIELLYHGVDTKTFRPLDKDEVRRKHGFEGKFVVGCVARNQPRKQYPLLVRAFAKLHAEVPESILYLHTDPKDVGWDLEHLVTRHGVDDYTVFSKVVTVSRGLEPDDLNFVYNAFHVMALPTMGEGFGLPLVEAMAAGVPVITTDYAAGRELVQGRGELIAVKEMMTIGPYNIDHAIADVDDLAERLIRLARDADTRERYAREGRAFAETLDWDVIMPQWLALFERLAPS
jgi:D-inositol-3-phosphate glycosyltransferase